MSDNAIALSQKIADFIVKAEFDRQNMPSKSFTASKEISEKLSALSIEIDHFKSVMTHIGAPQLCQATEKLIEDTQTEMASLEQMYHQTHDMITAQCENLNRGALTTVKNVSQLIVSVRHHNLHKLAEEKAKELHQGCEKSLMGVERTAKSFHWKNLSMVLLLSIMVTMIISRYISDLWPWQAHEQVVKQREAGKVWMINNGGK